MATNIKPRSFMFAAMTVAVSIFFAASCSSSPQRTNEANSASVEKPSADKSEENVKMYTQLWLDIINNGKVELLDTKFAPECVLRSAASEIKGQANVKAYYLDLLKAFSNPQFKVDQAFGKDDKVVKHWIFTGTHTGEFNGIKPTNKQIKFSGITIARIAEGKVVEETDYADDLGFLQQLGAVRLKEK